jgi:hypothetical protein
VHHDWDAVLSQSHIEFNSICAIVKRARESRQSILRRESGRAPVTND